MILWACFLLLFPLVLGYASLRVSRRRNGRNAAGKDAGFRPQIGFTRLDGMMSLSLLLDNESSGFVWAEEIEIFLNGLIAEEQTVEASCHEVQKIRQTIRAGDMLPISLCEAIYKAAGNPQRRYSCVISSILRYRVGEEWFEKAMESYKLRMLGLTVSGIRRERKPVPHFQIRVKSEEVPEISKKLK
jgi:hypothetical protein